MEMLRKTNKVVPTMTVYYIKHQHTTSYNIKQNIYIKTNKVCQKINTFFVSLFFGRISEINPT